MNGSVHWLDWPAPPNVKACFTTRLGGRSSGAFHSFNLAKHVGDDDAHVEQNRSQLNEACYAKPIWMSQVHGTHVLEAVPENRGQEADAGYSKNPGYAAVVMTADCLPAFFCNRAGTCVAVAHAGWRGLAAGVLENTLRIFNDPASDVLVFLGPAIGPKHFEVGEDVYQAFVAQDKSFIQAFLPGNAQGKYMADIYQLASLKLQKKGVTNIHGGNFCTFADEHRFYSYRRDSKTGRMASLIWLES